MRSGDASDTVPVDVELTAKRHVAAPPATYRSLLRTPGLRPLLVDAPSLHKKLAGKENRTMSELIREAFREYEQKRRWDEINAFGRAKAAELGITEDDVTRIVKESRKELARQTNRSVR